MLYPQLTCEVVEDDVARVASVTRGGRRFLAEEPALAWLEAGAVAPTELGAPGREPVRALIAVHPTDERACVLRWEGDDEALCEIDLETSTETSLGLPAGASALYVGPDRLLVANDGELVLFDHHPRRARRELARRSSYHGSLVAAVGPVVLLRGLEAPVAFFDCSGDAISVVGEVAASGALLLDQFAANDAFYLRLRVPLDEHPDGEQLVRAVLQPIPAEPVPSLEDVAPFHFDRVWNELGDLPPPASSWIGTRDHRLALGWGLAELGLARLAAASTMREPITLVLWFRERFRSVSLVGIPDGDLDEATRGLLERFDGSELDEAEAGTLSRALEPFWDGALGMVEEDAERPAVTIDDPIAGIVRVKTA